MNRELEDYYKARFDMFSSQGWNDLIEDVEKMIVSTNTLNGIDDEKKLYFRKGELSVMNWLKNLKDMSEEVHRNLKEHE